ncbi:hypothetical protein [Hoeflea olei]|uniref:Uncharacterized protein n=1 Tax=Hoeflea olei TaxID=1480615 RepID=A0A1C1YQM9_9HYPH|nr:hypothetical protein [Hoeflea olei]OCW55809.1 hypothetical protein AWJ14_15120 [Hoeflea olei]
MSHTASHAAPLASSAPTKTKIAAFLTAIGAIVLIGTEIWLGTAAAVWALDGVFGLGTTGDIVLLALFVPAALWATWMITKLAIAAELNPENAD